MNFWRSLEWKKNPPTHLVKLETGNAATDVSVNFNEAFEMIGFIEQWCHAWQSHYLISTKVVEGHRKAATEGKAKLHRFGLERRVHLVFLLLIVLTGLIFLYDLNKLVEQHREKKRLLFFLNSTFSVLPAFLKCVDWNHFEVMDQPLPKTTLSSAWGQD